MRKKARSYENKIKSKPSEITRIKVVM